MVLPSGRTASRVPKKSEKLGADAGKVAAVAHIKFKRRDGAGRGEHS